MVICMLMNACKASILSLPSFLLVQTASIVNIHIVQNEHESTHIHAEMPGKPLIQYICDDCTIGNSAPLIEEQWHLLYVIRKAHKAKQLVLSAKTVTVISVF